MNWHASVAPVTSLTHSALVSLTLLVGCGRYAHLIEPGPTDDDPVPGDAAPPEVCSGRAVSLAAAGVAMCAARDDGRVLCWGDGDSGHLSPASFRSLANPVVLPELEDVARVLGSDSLFCAVFRAPGKQAQCWGVLRFTDREGRSMLRDQPLPLGLAGGDLALGAGICALSAGTLTCWGGPFWDPLPLATDVVQVFWDSEQSVVALSREGVWTRFGGPAPETLTGFPEAVTAVSARTSRWALLLPTGEVALPNGGGHPETVSAFGTDNAAVEVGPGGQVCVVKASGGVICSKEVRPSAPAEVPGVSAAALALGWNDCALDRAGRVWCWAGLDLQGSEESAEVRFMDLATPTAPNLCP